MTKGFVIAVDALLAAVVLFSLLTLAFDTMKQDGTEWQVTRTLEMLAHHTGDALEVSGTLSRAVALNNTNKVREFLDGLPYNSCASVTVRPSPDSNQTIFTVSKSGCSSLLGESVRVTRGFIVASPPDANMYVATVSTWLNREV